MGLFEKLTNILMPMEDIEEEIEEEIKPVARQQEEFVEERRVANGGSTTSYVMPEIKQRPHLTVHTTPVSELNMQIYVPQNFDQVTAIADNLKASKAAIVNYERVEPEEQRRICDFLNGVCYVLDGAAKRISETMVLYVPAGVNVSEAMPVALPK